MRIIDAAPGDYINIGREGENNATQIRFGVAPWVKTYGEGRAEVIYQRPGDTSPYPVAVEQQGVHVLWTITATETANHGKYGKAELRYYVGDTLAKSAVSQIAVLDALGVPEDVPNPPGQDWLDQAIDAARRAEQAAVYPTIVKNGTWWVYDQELDEYVDTGSKAQGESGVYVGSGDMPEGYNVQIDPSGALEPVPVAVGLDALPQATEAMRGAFALVQGEDTDGLYICMKVGGVIGWVKFSVSGSTDATTSVLGEAVLGDMILGA